MDLARINPEGVQMDADVPTVAKVLQGKQMDGKGVVGMKIFGGGRLRNRVDECLQSVLRLEFIDALTIGQENQGEMQDLLGRSPDVSLKT